MLDTVYYSYIVANTQAGRK
nr:MULTISPECIES: hypothetical protein [Coprococcus]